MRRATLVSIAAALLAACGSSSSPALTSVSGDVMPFNNTVPVVTRIGNAEVCVLELPGHCVRTSDADADRGHFQLDGIEVGSEVTLTMSHPSWPLVQLATHVVPAGGLSRVSFQVPSGAQVPLLALAAGLTLDPTRCQIASTVTVVGKSVYDPGAHGEAGATVQIAPGGQAPVYFNASVVPQPGLTETSADGGILYGNVTPGVYTITATKPGVNIRPIKVNCRQGWILNASPPYGLQVY